MLSKIVAGLLLASATVKAAHIDLAPRAKCNDNCARAVGNTAGHFSTRGGAADCSAFLVTTVTPATSTVTVSSTISFTSSATLQITETTSTTTTPLTTQTVFVTSTGIVAGNLAKRAPTIPAYAVSSCTGDVTARYSSACSCLGVTSTVITAPTPVTTTTTYISETSTTTVATTTVATETATSTADTVVATVTDVIVPDVPCTISSPADFVTPCGGVLGQQGPACEISLGAGFSGVCRTCISSGKFCSPGHAENCCSGICSGFFCN